MPKCIVKGCQHSSGRKTSTPGVVLHPFPKDLVFIKKWLLQTKQDFGDLDMFAQGILEGKMGVSRICSVHFAPECYSLFGSEKVLLDGAIPTIFPDRDKPATGKATGFTPVLQTPVLQNVTLPIGLWTNNVSVVSGMAQPGPGVTFSQDNIAVTNAVGVNSRLKRKPNKRRKPPTKSSHPAKSRCNLPGLAGTIFPDLSPGKVNKGVQWPEYETNVSGEAWKILHDHYYRMPSGIRYQDIDCYSLLKDYMVDCGFVSYSGASYWESELFSMLQCVARFAAVNRSNKIKSARNLQQAVEIISMLSGEEWVIVNRNSIDKSVHQLTGECPVKCDDVAVYFTTEEWDYINEHRADYQDFITDPVTDTWEVPEHWDSDTMTAEEVEVKEELVEYAEEDDIEEEEEDDVKNPPKQVDSSDWEPGSAVESESEDSEDSYDQGKEEVDENPVKEEVQPHPCDQCAETFADDEALETHKMTHVEKCEDCEEEFTTKAELIKHRAENHAVKRFACTICGIQYDYKSQFIIHQRAHTGEKPFECEYCEAKFGYRSTLLLHERRHTNGKQFKCTKCDRRFDKKCDMIKHVKKAHEKTQATGKALKCSLCSKRFTRRSDMTKHVKKDHDSKKKFKCRKCGKIFAQQSSLEKHTWEYHVN
ncbi:uncharacterized protein ACNLHF_018980 isoform 2-T2 [Anomaloglossus baeobatrachus]|uniref:uncharacterized protein LOC142312511 n=1 Tax=Anomaloglossus baeobatrachus TaxID=238106 RepID=UPI003F4F65E3